MKRALFLLIWMLLLSVSCSKGRQLAAVEPLIQSRPDSVLVTLQNWDRSTLKTSRDKAYYALLYSMALDKCYVDVTEDSLTSVALNYFRNSKDRDHQMKAYYYDGLVQMNDGNTTGALMDLEKALALARQCQNLHYVGLAAKNLCMLHYYEWDYDESKRCAEESLDAFRMAGEDNYVIYSLLGLARCCQSVNENDESDRLHREVIQKSDQYPAARRSAYMSLAGLKMAQEPPDPHEALEAMDAYQRTGGKMYIDPATIKTRAFVLMGQMDSARVYLDIAREGILNAVDSARYFYALYQYLAAQKEFEPADEYLRKCYDIEDSLTVLRLKRSVMHAQKDWYKRDSEFQQALAEKRLVILVLVVFLALLSGILAIDYYRRKKREFDQEMDRFQVAEMELKEQVAILTEQDERQRAGLISMIVGRISVITMLGRQYAALQEAPSRESSYDYFDRMKTVVNDCRQEIITLRGDKTFLIGLEKAVDESNDNVIARLRRLFGESLQEQDYQIITLLVAGTPIKGISLVTGIRPGTLSTRKTRYKERILKTGTEDAAFFLEKIYRDPLKPQES